MRLLKKMGKTIIISEQPIVTILTPSYKNGIFSSLVAADIF